MKKIALTGKKGIGKSALVDDDLFNELNKYKWYMDNHGYATRLNGKTRKRILLARYIMGEPKDLIVDHIDHNPLNNQRNNLRICPRGVNSFNKKNEMRGTVMFKGVCKVQPKVNATNRYKASIKFQDKTVNIGYFSNPTEAAHAYNQFAMQLFGDYACLNEIPAE